MTDRKALEEAIERAKYEVAIGGRVSPALCRAEHLSTLVAAAEQHLATLPQTRMAEVWRLEFAFANLPPDQFEPFCCAYKTKERAEREAEKMRREPALYACIRVTGPHLQEIPATDHGSRG